MKDEEFRALLDLIMCSDPWPVNDKSNQEIIEAMAKHEAIERGFTGRVDAYHKFQKHDEITNNRCAVCDKRIKNIDICCSEECFGKWMPF